MRERAFETDRRIAVQSECDCPVHQSLSPAAHIDANFFNTGTGNSSDGIRLQIAFQADPSGDVFVFAQMRDSRHTGSALCGRVVRTRSGVTVTTGLKEILSWRKPEEAV